MDKTKTPLTEELNSRNEKLYDDISHAIIHDSMIRECFFRAIDFNRELIKTIEEFEKRVLELEEKNKVPEENTKFSIISSGIDDGNWFFMEAFCDGITYKVEAKIFKEPNTKYGLPESDYRISKFYVKDKTNNKTIVMSDRGYLVGEENLKEPLIKAFIKEVLDYSDKEFERYMITIED